jgi:steroid delta-isomerase-like uncharacterized protein
MAKAKKDAARAVVREYFDALMAKDLDRAVATWKPGSQDRLYGFAEMVAPHGIRDYFASIFAAIPDFTLEVDSMVAEGDEVAVRWSASGTHRGEQMGPRASHKEIAFRGISWIRFANGRIVEGWDSWNLGKLLSEMQSA